MAYLHPPLLECPTDLMNLVSIELVGCLITSPIRTLPSLYRAGVGCVSVEPSSILEGGAATLEPTVADGWFVSEITDNSSSSCLDVSSHTFFVAKTVPGLGHLMQTLPKVGSIAMGYLGKGMFSIPFQACWTGI